MTGRYSVRECLHGYTADALGVMCERRQLSANSKPSRIRALERVLQDTLHLKRSLEGISGDTARFLALVAEHGPVSVADARSVPALYAKGPAVASMTEAIELGLALACPGGRSGAFSLSELSRDWTGEEGSSPLLLVPEAVKELLPPAPPMGIEIPRYQGDPAPVAPNGRDRATTVFLETLRIVELLSPRVTATGAIHKSDEARAIELCQEIELPRETLALSLMTARELGCVAAKDGHLVTTEVAERWTAKPQPERVRDLFRAYLQAQDLPDIRLFFPQIYEAIEKHLPVNSLRRTYHRRLVARILAEIGDGAWRPVSAFVAAVARLDRNVLFVDERWRAILFNEQEPGAVWRDRQWQLRELRLFSWMIQRLLADLGMAELAADGAVFRLTPIGLYALGVGPPPVEDTPGGNGGAEKTLSGDALVIQPDFEIIVYSDRCPPDLRRKLDTFCERLRGGVVSTYRLTQESVYRGVRSGTPAQAFLKLLEESSKRALPMNVREQFAAWERKLQSVILRIRCEIVEFRDTREARTFVAEHAGSRLIGERFVLLDGAPPAIEPRIDYRLERRACIEQDEGLRIRAPWERRDLFVRRSLEEYGDLSEDSRGDLIMELSRAKNKKRDDWGVVVAELQAMLPETLASRYRIALRAWSGDLGKAGSATATLVRFEDPEMCDAVLEFPDVTGYVEGRLGLYTLALRQGRLGAFKKALKKHGITVQPASSVIDTAPPEEWAERWVDERRAAIEQQEALKEAEAAPDKKTKRIRRAEGSLPSYSPRIVCEIIEDAIARRRPLLIEYQTAWGAEPVIRRVDPVTIDTSGPTPSLSGYCHLRERPRTFQLHRLLGIRVLEDEQF